MSNKTTNNNQKIIFVGISILIIATITNSNLVNGSLFSPDKPEKPNLGMLTNPILVVEFDKLYDKYPDIKQQDVNELRETAVTKCIGESYKETYKINPDSADSLIGQIVGKTICNVLISSTIASFLGQLDIQYYVDTSTEQWLPILTQ